MDDSLPSLISITIRPGIVHRQKCPSMAKKIVQIPRSCAETSHCDPLWWVPGVQLCEVCELESGLLQVWLCWMSSSLSTVKQTSEIVQFYEEGGGMTVCLPSLRRRIFFNWFIIIIIIIIFCLNLYLWWHQTQNFRNCFHKNPVFFLQNNIRFFSPNMVQLGPHKPPF